MVTVEADALAGPALAKRAGEAGVVYSMAYGDQPALIVELVDWARTSGFDVACAGKGAKCLEHYHDMNPDNVWEIHPPVPGVRPADGSIFAGRAGIDVRENRRLGVSPAAGVSEAPQWMRR